MTLAMMQIGDGISAMLGARQIAYACRGSSANSALAASSACRGS
jgi:hypothetical protein